MRIVSAGKVIVNEVITNLNPKIVAGNACGLYLRLSNYYVYEVGNSGTNKLILESFIRQLCKNKNRAEYFLSIPCSRVPAYLAHE